MARHLVLLTLLLSAACTGGLEHRSMAPMKGDLAIPPGVTKVRVEIDNGSLDVQLGKGPSITYRGQVRRATDSAEQLQRFEGQGSELTAAVDPQAKDVLVLRGPSRPDGGDLGVLAVELILDIPDGLAVALIVRGSGNLAIDTRAAAVELDCGRGDLRMKRTRGPARLHSGRGNVIADDHSGDLDVRVDVGDMQVFVREPGARLRLVTGMGNVQCLVPPAAQFRVEARTQTGKMANGFGLPIEREGFRSWMTGQRGDGRTELVMHSGKGHLSLSHKTFD
ncbi:MAG: hypothetical protein ABL997_04130 [Planctomycetota bacterium]